MDSQWIIEARRRWYHCRILGDGHFAVVVCNSTVRLTDMEMWAHGLVEHDCSILPGACRLRHTLHDLRDQPSRKYTGQQALRVTADRIERDK